MWIAEQSKRVNHFENEGLALWRFLGIDLSRSFAIAVVVLNSFGGLHKQRPSGQWPFQEPKPEVPTIYKAYVREYPHKIWPYMVQYLHFRILKFPLTQRNRTWNNFGCFSQHFSEKKKMHPDFHRVQHNYFKRTPRMSRRMWWIEKTWRTVGIRTVWSMDWFTHVYEKLKCLIKKTVTNNWNIRILRYYELEFKRIQGFSHQGRGEQVGSSPRWWYSCSVACNATGWPSNFGDGQPWSG